MIERDITEKARAPWRKHPVIALTGPRQSGKTTLAPVWILALCALALLAAAPFLGIPLIHLREVLGAETGVNNVVFHQLRLPRTLAAFLVGSALAAGGCVFQAVFRNALATPFTLGVSGGASLGVALSPYIFGGLSMVGFAPNIGAFGGAMLSIALVYGLSRLRRGFATSDMLLAGVSVSFLFSSLVMLVQYLGDPDKTLELLTWMMGGVALFGLRPLIPLAVPLALSLCYLLLRTQELDLLLLGEELAESRGLDTRRFRQALFLVVSLMVGTCVAVCGPVGFVGLMVPHACRLAFGARHRTLLPASCLAGGMLLVACDIVARTIIAPAELPVGILTSLLGAPFFLWLLHTGRTEL